MNLDYLGERAWIDRTRYGLEGIEPGDRVSHSYVKHKRPWDDDLDDYLEIILVNHVFDRDAYGRDMLSESNFQVWKDDERLMAHSLVVSWMNVDQMALIVRESYEGEEGDDWVTSRLDGFEDYPVLDEEHYSGMEIAAVDAGWSDSGWEMQELRSFYLPDEYEDVEGDAIRDAMSEWEGLYSPDYGFENGGPSYSKTQLEEVAALIRKTCKPARDALV